MIILPPGIAIELTDRAQAYGEGPLLYSHRCRLLFLN